MPLVLDGTNGVSGVDGTASNPAIEGTDSNTGIFYPAADTVAIGTGGTEALRVNSSQNVGIGTSSPTAASSRRGLVLRGNANGAELIVQSTSATDGTSDGFSLTTVGTDAYLFNRLNGFTAFATNNTERARITSGGNVGISNTNPQSLLSVGAVSPGTAEATNKGLIQICSAGGGSATGGGGLEFKSAASGNGYGFQISCPDLGATNVPLVFSARNDTAAWTECARINNTGTLFINQTTNDFDTSLKFYARTTAATSWTGLFKVEGGATSVPLACWNNATSGTRMQVTFRDSLTGNERGKITTDGANTTYGTSSDYRLKENIAALVGGLNKVMQLKPSVWTWKENQASGQGFIAHELAEIVPDAVIGEKDAVETYTDKDGNEQTRPSYQSVDTSFLVATLTAAIQELNAKVEAQAAEIAALKGNA